MALPLWTILVATVTFALFWLSQKKRQETKKKLQRLGLKALPGPKGLPFIGSLHQMTTVPNVQYSKWAKEFGPIYQVNLGGQTMVNISDPKLTKEIYSDSAFSGRPENPFCFYEATPYLGIVGSEGEKWEVHRRFLLRQLRDFGFGKSSMQALISDEVAELIQSFKKKEGTPIGELRRTLRLAVVNSLWRIITSKRFDQDDPALKKLSMDTSEGFQKVLSGGAILLTMPWLKHWIPEASGYNALRKLLGDMQSFLTSALEEKKGSFRDGDQNDFLDVYLAEMKKNENNPSSHFHGELGEHQLMQTMFELFVAGSDTTATTLSWGVLYLCKFPENQKRFQREITEVTGDSRSVSVDDRPNMPYTLALIDEILRYSSHIPDGVPHKALQDKEFHGFLIEKGSFIWQNTQYIHYDRRIWGDPENFRPDRFLSPDGRKYVKSENMQAFQVGRRQCVGETLARDSLFLYLTSLFQEFEMKFNPDEKEPSVDSTETSSRHPLPYEVIMRSRLK